MIGAIAGDVIGSCFSGSAPRSKTFPLFDYRSRFTEGTVLTIAIADAVRTDGDYAAALRRWAERYPYAGYGSGFAAWVRMPQQTLENRCDGSAAVRVSGIGWAFDDLEEALAEANKSARVTHLHPDSIRAAEAVAAAVLLSRLGRSKAELAALLAGRFGYDCSTPFATWRQSIDFATTNPGIVTTAFAAFFASTDFEDALRNAVSLGGNTNARAAITGAIAEPFYGGVADPIVVESVGRLDEPLRLALAAFMAMYLKADGSTSGSDPTI